MKLTFAIVYERTPNNYGAYAPELPGCVSVGETREEVQEMMREAVAFHIEAMVEHGERIPESRMTPQEAAAYHEKALGDCDAATNGLFPDTGNQLPATVGMIEVEVAPYSEVGRLN